MHGNRWSPVNLGPQEAGLWQCGWVLGSCPRHPRPAEVSSLEGLSERRWGASATTLSPRERPWPEPLPEAQGGPLLPGDHVLTSGRPPPEGVANCLGGVAFPGFQGWGGRFGEAGGGCPCPPHPHQRRCPGVSGSPAGACTWHCLQALGDTLNQTVSPRALSPVGLQGLPSPGAPLKPPPSPPDHSALPSKEEWGAAKDHPSPPRSEVTGPWAPPNTGPALPRPRGRHSRRLFSRENFT